MDMVRDRIEQYIELIIHAQFIVYPGCQGFDVDLGEIIVGIEYGYELQCFFILAGGTEYISLAIVVYFICEPRREVPSVFFGESLYPLPFGQITANGYGIFIKTVRHFSFHEYQFMLGNETV